MFLESKYKEGWLDSDMAEQSYSCHKNFFIFC